MNTCNTCKHWRWPFHLDRAGNEVPDEFSDICRPLDYGTGRPATPIEVPFQVRECSHPELMFSERPLREDGFAVADCSNYAAHFYTSEKFGCVLWEAKDAKDKP